MGGGRPTIYSQELADRICEIVATNPLGYRKLEAMFPEMPHYSTLLAWRRSKPEFSEQYLNAKRFQAEILVEDIDDLIPGEIKYYVDDKGFERIDSPSAALVVAKINNRKWTASKLVPKLYGDQKQIEQLQDSNSKLQQELNELRAQLADKYKKDY